MAWIKLSLDLLHKEVHAPLLWNSCRTHMLSTHVFLLSSFKCIKLLLSSVPCTLTVDADCRNTLFSLLSSLPLLPSKSELTYYSLPVISECSLPKIRACISSCMLVIHVGNRHYSSTALSCPSHSPGPLLHFFSCPPPKKNTKVSYIWIKSHIGNIRSISLLSDLCFFRNSLLLLGDWNLTVQVPRYIFHSVSAQQTSSSLS